MAIKRQITQERDSDMAGVKSRLENAMLKGMDMMEQRLEEVARQGRQELTDMVVSALTSSITKRMEQVVSQEMKRMLHSPVAKLGGLKNKMAKELATSQSREAIGRAVVKSLTDMFEGSYRQEFGQQTAGSERAIGSMLQQIIEQFMAYFAFNCVILMFQKKQGV